MSKKKETVKITVVQEFRNKLNTREVYQVGTELEFEAERAADVVERGLAEYVGEIG